MYYLKTNQKIENLDDFAQVITKIAELKNSEWILQNTPFDKDKEDARQIIKQSLKEKGLKSTWLAEQLGITKNHLSKILNGKENITEQTINKIYQILNINN